MAPQELSPAQAHALFDILTHHEMYSEIGEFKFPGVIDYYGPPFKTKSDEPSTSPLLQVLLSRFIVPLPGLKNAPKEFWQDRVQNLVNDFGNAELSESYDKGVIGIRKLLATAYSALLEYPSRGVYGGVAKQQIKERDYDPKKAEDVVQAFDDLIQRLLYADQIDKMFKRTAETDKLEEHESLVQAAHEFILVNLACFMHYIYVVLPKGQALLSVVESVHKLVPYGMIKQTLKVGNVATMINGMVKLLLAKVSVQALTNWLGVSQNANEGMNALQQIMSTVFNWEMSDLMSRAAKIEKSKETPIDPKQLHAIEAYVKKDRAEHEKCRAQSQTESKSMIAIILEEADLPTDLSNTQHKLANDYFSIQLSLHDRQKLKDILCTRHPDLLTQGIRDLVGAYEPMIRQVHQAVDLSATMGQFEAFMNDMIKLARTEDPKDSKNGKSGTSRLPSVEDFVKLLRKHQGTTHQFMHQVAKNGKEVTEWFRLYSHEIAAHYQVHSDKQEDKPPATGAGKLTPKLNELFTKLSEADRDTVAKQADAHAKYLANLAATSQNRLKDIISNPNAQTKGPGAGMYLARWQDLLDNAPMEPGGIQGPVRRGKDVSVREASRVDIDGEDKGIDAGGQEVLQGKMAPPDVEKTVQLLGPKFKELLRQESTKAGGSASKDSDVD